MTMHPSREGCFVNTGPPSVAAVGVRPNQPQFIQAWIVLDECKQTESLGYLIAFYPERKMHGLAVKDDPFPAFIGCYGSLVATIAAM